MRVLPVLVVVVVAVLFLVLLLVFLRVAADLGAVLLQGGQLGRVDLRADLGLDRKSVV